MCETDSGTRTTSLKAAVLRRGIEAAPTWVDVYGPSMGRSVRDGQRVRLVPLHRLRRGLIYAFVDHHGRLVVHRFRGHSDGLFWFRGDGNGSDDRPVERSAVVGRVDAVEGQRPVIANAHTVFARTKLDIESVLTKARRTAHRVRSRAVREKSQDL